MKHAKRLDQRSFPSTTVLEYTHTHAHRHTHSRPTAVPGPQRGP